MVFTIDDIRKRVIPIVIKYGISTFSLFGSYAREEANENSDLEDEFNCHVDVVSKGSSNKKFLEAISKEEVLLYERKR